MQNDNARRPAFDEQAALEELERLRDAIEESRRRRSERSDEFEAFVRSFRTPGSGDASGGSIDDRPPEPRPEYTYPGRQNRDPEPKPQTVVFDPPLGPAAPRETPPPTVAPPAPSAPVPPRPAPEQITAREATPPIGPPTVTPAPVPPVPVPPPASVEAPRVDPSSSFAPAPVTPEPEPARAALASDAPSPSRAAAPRSIAPWAVVATVVVVGAAALAMKPWASRSPESTESSAAASPGPAEPAPQASPAPQESAPAPAASSGTHAMEAELVADRRVWVRVTADGEKLLERELPAGTRVPITAERAIVIRAGDAGAVRLRLNGTDRGTLGRDAEVLTRTFTPQ